MSDNPQEDKKEEKERPMDILKKYKLTLEQEMFCQYFTSPTEFYGNGVQSYASAYNHDLTDERAYNVAKSRASQLLSNLNVLARINDLLDASGFNDENVDKQLLFLISQAADFRSKLGAIKEYNKLKARVTDKIDIQSGGVPITTINIIPIAKKTDDDGGDNSPPADTVEPEALGS